MNKIDDKKRCLNEQKLYCEMSYLEKVRDCYKENGMMFRFYDFLNKINKKNEKKNKKDERK